MSAIADAVFIRNGDGLCKNKKGDFLAARSALMVFNASHHPVSKNGADNEFCGPAPAKKMSAPRLTRSQKVEAIPSISAICRNKASDSCASVGSSTRSANPACTMT